MVMDFSIVERPAGKATSAFRLALEETANTGMALEIRANGQDRRLISSRLSGGYSRAMKLKGLRLRTRWSTDKSVLFAWTEKLETTS